MAVLLSGGALARATPGAGRPHNVASLRGAALHLPPGTDPSLSAESNVAQLSGLALLIVLPLVLLFLLPQEAAGRGLGHVNNVDRTERIETR